MSKPLFNKKSISEKIVLVDNPVFASNLKQFMVRKERSFAGLKVMDFSTFVTDTLAPVFIDFSKGKKVLNSRETMRLLYSCLSDMVSGDSGHILSVCIQHPGYRFPLMDFVTKMKLSGIDPDAAESALSTPKLKSLHDLLKAYNRALVSAGGIDYPDLVTNIIESINSMKTNPLSGMEIIAHINSAGTWCEKRLLDLVKHKASSYHEITDYRELTSGLTGTEKIELHAFPNSYMESASAASRLLSSGIDYEDTIIAAVNYDETVQNIRDILSDWGIEDNLSVEFTGGVPVNWSLSHKLFNKILEFISAKNYPAYFMSLLTNRAYHLPEIIHDTGDTVKAGRGAVRELLSGFQGHFRFKEISVKTKELMEDEDNQYKKDILSAIAKMTENFQGLSLAFSPESGYEEKIHALCDFYEEACSASLGEFESRARRAILDSIMEFADEELFYLGGKSMDIILHELKGHISRIYVKEDKEVSSLKVMPLRQALGRSPGALYVTGLSYGSFPATAVQNPLFLDAEIAELNRAAGENRMASSLDETEINGKEIEKLLFTAGERLSLSYVFYDGKRVVAPSEIFFELNSGAYEGAENLEDFISAIGGETDLTELNSRMHEHFPVNPYQSPALLEKGDSFPAYNESYRSISEVLARRFLSDSLTSHDGRVMEKGKLDWMKDFSIKLSASSLKDLLQCPFRYYMKKILRAEYLEPPDDPDGVTWLNAMSRGSVMHEILEGFFNKMRLEGTGRKERLKILYKVAEEIFLQWKEETLPDKNIYEHEKNHIMGILEKVLANEDIVSKGFSNAMAEAAFGLKEKNPGSGNLLSEDPVTISLGGYDIPMTGYIDRIDIDAKNGVARLIDYKTGKNRLDSDQLVWIKNGDSLQHVVYGMIFSGFLKNYGAERIESGYYFITPDGGYELELMDFESALAGFQEMAGAVLQGIIDSKSFYMNTNSCRYCDYGRMCVGNMTALKWKYPDKVIRAIQAVAMEDKG